MTEGHSSGRRAHPLDCRDSWCAADTAGASTLTVPVYRGRFSKADAERLLWRAGFGPRRGQPREVQKLGLDGAVHWLTHPPPEKLEGRAPRDDKGRRLHPADAWGHDHLWWLDRMVRSNRPLVERMTLVWHDWFATSNDGVGSQALMLRQNRLFRRYALGNFRFLVHSITADPAMLLWLSGVDNEKGRPNENFARELMELFTLGEGNGYTEHDVREQARSLTGFRYEWKRNRGPTSFRFDRRRHDGGLKTVFGKQGRFDWRDACNLCLDHPRHATFLVEKLWSYFIPTPPPVATRRALEHVYREHYEIGPVLEGILRHPALYLGPRMVKPPVVYIAGLLRGLNRPIDTSAWVWLSEGAGQKLFNPPNVAGWNDERWLDTQRFRGRWFIAGEALGPYVLGEGRNKKVRGPRKPEQIVENAIWLLGNPELRPETRNVLLAFTRAALGDATEDWKRDQYPTLVANAVRQLLAVSPDLQTC